MTFTVPPHDCPRCPRLAGFRADNRVRFPSYHNAPVASFGPEDARLLILGLAPGLHGANQTGRPFTGDYAGDLLYPTLVSEGFASGDYGRRPDDGLQLKDCRISNAVRCVPPENKPTTAEIKACRPFFEAELANLKQLRIVLALGRIAHDQLLATLGLRRNTYAFAHGALHRLPNGLLLADSYHCSRYNVNTRRLTPEMFHTVVARLRAELDAAPSDR
ncbi:uracil-DNA glycosylase [Aquibaculum arenosum]|uniref:Type-5 uracil-DNA glycosylase n=1 Tax=Aquibaculum arenosum TaxID=3032591 RepID=A0ABT5YKD7_9PROT|nr:uracil-DNA glycosylase [Fodinicurvata sp. CAU 1616]MDF2095291.1 uracil-DNA glycosylase [Fodinicurvata sp. CAU 1616]